MVFWGSPKNLGVDRRYHLISKQLNDRNMKTKELIINEIEARVQQDYANYLIGFRTFPVSEVLLEGKNIKIVYGENCTSENDAKKIIEYFVGKGMQPERQFSLNIAKGIFIIKKS